MNCDEFLNRVFELARGELSGGDAEEAARHMDECPKCREEYGIALRLAEGLSSLGNESAPQSLLPNVMKAVSAEKRRKRLNIVRFGSAAAAAVVLVAGTVSVLPRLMERHANNSAAVQNGGEEMDERADIPEEAAETAGGAVYEPESATEGETLIEPESGDARAESREELNEKSNEKKGPEAAPRSVILPDQETPADTADQPETAVDEAAAVSLDETEEKPEKTEKIALTSGAVTRMNTGEEADADSAETAVDGEAAADGGQAYTYGPFDEPVVAVGSGRRGGSGGGTAYISRAVEFEIGAEFADAVSGVVTEGMSGEEVAAQLDALGVSYSLSVDETDMTNEYYNADAERKKEIEALCSSERCTLRISDE